MAGLRLSPECRFFIERGAREALGSCVGETRRPSPLFLIELGCGHAGLSAYLAALRCAAVIATDLPEFLYRADVTAEANEDFYGELQEKPRSLKNFRTAPLPFGDREALERIFRDLEMVGSEKENRKVVMVGAGVTYWECLFEPLMQTIADFFDLCSTSSNQKPEDSDCTPEVYIAYFRRNWGGCEKRLWTKLMPKRFSVDVVAEEFADEHTHIDPRVFAPYCMRDAEQCQDWNLRLYRIRPKDYRIRPKQLCRSPDAAAAAGGGAGHGLARSPRETRSPTAHKQEDEPGLQLQSNEERRRREALERKIAKEAALAGSGGPEGRGKNAKNAGGGKKETTTTRPAQEKKGRKR